VKRVFSAPFAEFLQFQFFLNSFFIPASEMIDALAFFASQFDHKIFFHKYFTPKKKKAF